MSDDSNHFSVSRLGLCQIDEDFITQWRRLEASSIQDNAFLSPSFILPAIQNLVDPDATHFVAVYGPDREVLSGLGIFTYSAGSVDFPLPHFVAFKSVHSYLSGMLISKSNPEAIAKALFLFLGKSSPRIFGVKFSSLDLSGQFGQVIRSLDQQEGMSWLATDSKQRAWLDPNHAGHSWDYHVSARRRKNYRRSLKKLASLQPVSWRLLRNDEVERGTIDTLLRLEDMGWKKKRKFSLLSQTGQREFFTRTVENYARHNQVFFCELLVGTRVIASTCNFISGNNGFAFKIGWDPEYWEFSPGIMNEMELMRNAGSQLASLEAIDSGATEDSFINSYWGNRKTLFNGAITFGAFATTMFRFMHQFRRAKRWLAQVARSFTRGKRAAPAQSDL
jgi:Acetyltransferase (GNAT) domain